MEANTGSEPRPLPLAGLSDCPSGPRLEAWARTDFCPWINQGRTNQQQMKAHNKNALSRVRKFFPHVNKVKDAKEGILITVIAADNKTARKKDPANCALAVACKRQGIADAAIINVGFSYLIKGDVATRYKTSGTVGREITSFDRHQDFAEGKNYRLSRIGPSAMLGRAKKWYDYPEKNLKKQRPSVELVHKHRTSRIRVSKPS